MFTCAKLLQSCLILCDPMDCIPPGSSVHGILQARTVEWVAISYSRGCSLPRDWAHVSMSPALQVCFLPLAPLGKPQLLLSCSNKSCIRGTCSSWQLSKHFSSNSKRKSINLCINICHRREGWLEDRRMPSLTEWFEQSPAKMLSAGVGWAWDVASQVTPW